jgi:hypothetical protein
MESWGTPKSRLNLCFAAVEKGSNKLFFSSSSSSSSSEKSTSPETKATYRARFPFLFVSNSLNISFCSFRVIAAFIARLFFFTSSAFWTKIATLFRIFIDGVTKTKLAKRSSLIEEER